MSLHALWVVKNSPSCFRDEDRNMGYASYAVPGLTWDKQTWGNKGSTRDLADVRKAGYDLVIHEDGGSWCTYTSRGAVPLVYLSIDDTLSEDHLRNRVNQARQADLVLVDHGPLGPFIEAGCHRVLRLNYCVNEKVFHPAGRKTTDVVFHCSAGNRQGEPGAAERIRTRQLLDTICKRHGWTYRSGTRGLEKYALSLAQARVVVNVPRTPLNRPHRVFDTMASGSCLLTAPIPQVSGDRVRAGVHYETFSDDAGLERKLEQLLGDNTYRQFMTDQGADLVASDHTWWRRSGVLLTVLAMELGL